MLVEIENKILAWLEDAGLGIKAVDVTKGESIKKPAGFVYTEVGNFSKATMNKFKCELDLYVLIAFRSVRDEEARRHGLYPILEGVINGLMGQTLGLSIKPLAPKSFQNITDKEMREKKTLLFQILFNTSFVMEPVDTEEIAELLSIGLTYYLQDPEDDGVADASDLVEFEEE